MTTSTDPYASRFAEMESQLVELRRSIDGLEQQNAALRRSRTIAIGLAALALCTPALLFLGKLSPRFKTVHVTALEGDIVRARSFIIQTNGQSHGSFFGTDTGALLTLNAGGSSVTLHADESSAGLSANASQAKESILLNVSGKDSSGGIISIQSGAAAARLDVKGDSTELSLSATGGRVRLGGRKPDEKTPFVAALEMNRDVPKFMGAHVYFGIGSSGGQLALEDAEGKAKLATRLYVDHDFGAALTMANGEDNSLLATVFKSPNIQGVVKNDTTWSLPAKK